MTVVTECNSAGSGQIPSGDQSHPAAPATVTATGVAACVALWDGVV